MVPDFHQLLHNHSNVQDSEDYQDDSVEDLIRRFNFDRNPSTIQIIPTSTMLTWLQKLSINLTSTMFRLHRVQMVFVLPDDHPRPPTVRRFLRPVESLESDSRFLRWHRKHHSLDRSGCRRRNRGRHLSRLLSSESHRSRTTCKFERMWKIRIRLQRIVLCRISSVGLQSETELQESESQESKTIRTSKQNRVHRSQASRHDLNFSLKMFWNWNALNCFEMLFRSLKMFWNLKCFIKELQNWSLWSNRF